MKIFQMVFHIKGVHTCLIKVTVFKITSHFTQYLSVISSLLIILTEICIFSKFFKQMHVLQKQTEICTFSACVSHSVKC